MASFLPSVSDLREMSFQQVVDNIFKPNGVKVGGFPEEIFVNMTEEEKEAWTCNICYMVANEPSECDNKHIFCRTCIFAWSLTAGENSQKCPMCRCEMPGKYPRNKEIQKTMEDKRVNCPETDCSFKAPLKIFLMHSHGKKMYANGHIDLESLRPARHERGAGQVMVLPFISTEGMSRTQRGQVLRSQLQQGRAMIHQMMMLLHLEMQLRQQALNSYNTTHDPVTRLARLDEVLALNEQLNEVGPIAINVGGILSGLLNSPLQQMMSGSNTGRSVTDAGDDDTDESEPAIPATQASALTSTSNLQPSPMRISAPTLDNSDEDDDEDESDDESDDSDDSQSNALLQHRLQSLRQRREAHDASRARPPASTTLNTSSADSNPPGLTRARRPSEIRAGLLAGGVAGSGGGTSISNPEPHRLQQRVLLNREPQSRSRSRQGNAGSVTVQRLGGESSNRNNDSQSQTATRTSLPAIATASPRPSETSPRSNQAATTRDSTSPVGTTDTSLRSLPGGSSTLQRAMQGMNGGEAQSNRTRRSNLVPRTNGEFAANQLSRSPSQAQRSIPVTQSNNEGSSTNQSASNTSNSHSSAQSLSNQRPQSSTRGAAARGRSESRPQASQASESSIANRSRRTQSQSRPQNGTSPNRTPAGGAARRPPVANNGGLTPRRNVVQNRVNPNAAEVTNRLSRPTINNRLTTRRTTNNSSSGTTGSTSGDGGSATRPTTPGQLLRVRRRSEISQDLMRRAENGS